MRPLKITLQRQSWQQQRKKKIIKIACSMFEDISKQQKQKRKKKKKTFHLTDGRCLSPSWIMVTFMYKLITKGCFNHWKSINSDLRLDQKIFCPFPIKEWAFLKKKKGDKEERSSKKPQFFTESTHPGIFSEFRFLFSSFLILRSYCQLNHRATETM